MQVETCEIIDATIPAPPSGEAFTFGIAQWVRLWLAFEAELGQQQAEMNIPASAELNVKITVRPAAPRLVRLRQP